MFLRQDRRDENGLREHIRDSPHHKLEEFCAAAGPGTKVVHIPEEKLSIGHEHDTILIGQPTKGPVLSSGMVKVPGYL